VAGPICSILPRSFLNNQVLPLSSRLFRFHPTLFSIFFSRENVGKFKEENVIYSRVELCLEVLLAEKNEGTRNLLLAENSRNALF
jgi:hypothetical protein